MGITRKISFTILALTLSAQIGNFDTQQGQIGEGPIIKAFQQLVLPMNHAQAAGDHWCNFTTYNGRSDGLTVTYTSNGTTRSSGINGATGTTLDIEQGTTFTVYFNGRKNTYNAPSRSMLYTIQADGTMTQSVAN